MSMWRTVARLEWRILRRDRAALAVLALFAAFLLVAAFAGGRQASGVAEGLERAQALEAQRVAAMRTRSAELESRGAPLSAKDPRDAVWIGQQGTLAVLPPAPLAAVAVGQRDLHPQAVRVSTSVHLTAERETETPMSGPTRLTTGAFDPAFLFVVLFPLVVIALSYELLTGERERGTLAMLLSQPLSQRALVFGKAGARWVALCGVTLSFAGVGLLVAGVPLGGGAWLPAALYGCVLAAWALFWFAAAVAVNAWGQTSAGNALLLVGLWLVVVVVVPGLVNVTVDAVHPAPSRVELMHEAREAALEVERELAGLEGRHDRDTKTAGYAREVVDVQQELARRSAPVLGAMREQVRARQALVETLRFLSPAIVVQLALEDVAGSGAARQQRFEAQVDALHGTFRDAWFARVRAGRRVSAGDLASIPTLVFEDEPAATLAGRVLSGVLGLLLAALALFWIALPGLRRVGRLAG